MSIQLLREPLRSIRQHTGIKPWPFLNAYNHSNKLSTQHIPQLFRSQQSKLPLNSKWPLILVAHRSYSAVAARSLPPTTDPGTTVSPKSTKPRKSTNTSRSLWADYQHKLNYAKNTLDIKYFDRLLTLLLYQAPSSKKSVAWSRIADAFETATTLKLEITPNMYMTAVTAYGRLNNAKLVTLTFQEYKRHFRVKRLYYPRYMAALLDCGELSSALDLFRNIKSNPTLGAKDASLCLALLVPAYCQTNKKVLWQLALKATDELDHIDQWQPQARSQITQALWETCLKSIKAPMVDISAEAAESLVSTYLAMPSNATNIKKSSQHVFTLFRLLCHYQGFVPTAKTCNWVLESQLHEGQLARVKSILQWMQQFNMEPNSTTVSLLLSTFGDQLPLSQIRALYNMLPSDDIQVYKTFIKVFSASTSKDLIEAQTVISKMKQHGYDLDSACYSSMAQGFVKRSQMDKGWIWLSQSNCTDLDSYAVIMEAWLNRGQWQMCIQHYDSLKKQHSGVDMNRRLVKALLTAQFADNQFQAADALLTTTRMKFTATTVFRVLNTLLSLETVKGSPLVSGEQVVKATRMMETILKVYLTADGIGRIITRLGERGYGKSGFQLYNWVREGSNEANRTRCASSSLYYAMMSCATNTNDTRVLERAWVDMQYRKQYLAEGCTTKELHGLSAYNILLNGFASRLPRPDLTRVKRTFSRMLKQSLSPDLVTYNIMIKAFVSANNMEGAFQIFKKLKSEDIKPDARTVNTLLNGWIIRKDWPQVERFMEELKNTDNLDMVTFNLLVQSFLQLDSKTMNYQHILKQQNKWKDWRQMQVSASMSSEKVWSVIESTTGHNKSSILNALAKKKPRLDLDETSTSLCHQLIELKTRRQPSIDNPKDNAFITLFSKNQEPDEVTYKLFMKAFVNVGDFKSAHLVYKWMQYRL
jgi:pentatricopeptide repeat protein